MEEEISHEDTLESVVPTTATDTVTLGEGAEIKYQVSTSEFIPLVNDVIMRHKNIVNDTESYYESKGKPVAIIRRKEQDPETMDRSLLYRALQRDKKEFEKRAAALKKYFSASVHRSRKFTHVTMYMNRELRDFFVDFLEESEKGDALAGVEKELISDEFPMIKQGLAHISTLLCLFSLYARKRGLQDKDAGQYYRGDKLLGKYFGADFQVLARKGKTMDKNGKREYDAQSIEHFRFPAFRTIIANHSKKRKQLSEDELEFIQQKDIKDLLEKEFIKIDSLVQHYKSTKAKAEKRMKDKEEQNKGKGKEEQTVTGEKKEEP
jgi:hypothetical protein